MKIRICIDCSKEMEVPNTSSKKRCYECFLINSRKKAKEWYSENYRPCRKRSYLKHKEKLINEPVYRLLYYGKKRSRELGIEFNLSEEDIKLPKICPILKTPFEYKTYYTYSIDRIDNSKGYIKGNIQIISHKANAMKNSASNEELLKFAKWVLKNVPEET